MTVKAAGLVTLREVLPYRRHQIALTRVRGEWMLRKQAETCCFGGSGNEADRKG